MRGLGEVSTGDGMGSGGIVGGIAGRFGGSRLGGPSPSPGGLGSNPMMMGGLGGMGIGRSSGGRRSGGLDRATRLREALTRAAAQDRSRVVAEEAEEEEGDGGAEGGGIGLGLGEERRAAAAAPPAAVVDGKRWVPQTEDQQREYEEEELAYEQADRGDDRGAVEEEYGDEQGGDGDRYEEEQ